MITAEKLGSEHFRDAYGLRYDYVAGAMVKAIASVDMVISLGRAGYLGFYGAGGMRLGEIEAAIKKIQEALCNGEHYGINFLSSLARPELEFELVNLLLRYEVRHIEASAFMNVTPALIKYRLSGLHRDEHQALIAPNKIMAKISRPEIALVFMSPPAAHIVERLLSQGEISASEAALAAYLPVASEVTVEADSGGHTDMGVAAVLIPAILRVREALQQRYQYDTAISVGAGGGIGTPEAAASAFLLGADYIVTGSIIQCTVEAGTSDLVKDMLQETGVRDTSYAPAGDMFEMGSKIQVMKKGVFFASKANKLYDLWSNFGGLEQLELSVRKDIQEKYFRRSFGEVYDETKTYYLKEFPSQIEKAERNPKVKMALVFRWYFVHSMRLARAGVADQRVDFQVHCGPALGAFNQWVQRTQLESWRQRKVVGVADHLMQGCAEYINRRWSFFG